MAYHFLVLDQLAHNAYPFLYDYPRRSELPQLIRWQLIEFISGIHTTFTLPELSKHFDQHGCLLCYPSHGLKLNA
jgi:hypothetical protein